MMTFTEQDRKWSITLSEGSLSMGPEMLSVMIPLRGLITELRSA